MFQPVHAEFMLTSFPEPRPLRQSESGLDIVMDFPNAESYLH